MNLLPNDWRRRSVDRVQFNPKRTVIDRILKRKARYAVKVARIKNNFAMKGNITSFMLH
jgi:hypothetical protein